MAGLGKTSAVVTLISKLSAMAFMEKHTGHPPEICYAEDEHVKLTAAWASELLTREWRR